jgi:MFS family permease
MVLSAFIGTVLGNAIPGALADWLVKSMSRKNNGVYEPEYRLILSIPALILGLAGFWGFGLSIDAQNHWMVPVFFFGLATFSGSILSLISNTYLLDCHRKYATDAYAAVTLVKGVMAFTIPFFINDWITKNGVVQVFFIVGLIHGIAAIWGIVLYVYGKRVSDHEFSGLTNHANSLISYDSGYTRVLSCKLICGKQPSEVVVSGESIKWASQTFAGNVGRFLEHRVPGSDGQSLTHTLGKKVRTLLSRIEIQWSALAVT